MRVIKVLLVEDDETTLKSLAKILKREGIDVFEATNGQTALTLFQKESPDILITDLNLPGIDGLELMKRAKQLCQEVPVILITGFGQTDVVINAIRLGALDYIRKPIDLEQLLVAVGRAKEMVLNAEKNRFFPTVLIVEDDAPSRNELVGILAKEDYNVVAAENGRVGVEIFKSRKIDITLLDINMPELDGIQALQAMRCLSDDFEAIVLTGYGDEASAILALRNGAMNFIRKPIDLEDLLASLEKGIERLSLARALKHRTRELELAHEVIAQINEDTEITVRLPSDRIEDTLARINVVMDQISPAVAVVDEDLNLLYCNQSLKASLRGQPTKIDAEFASVFAARFREAFQLQHLRDSLARLFDASVGTVETFVGEGTSCAILTKIGLNTSSGLRKYAVLLFS